MDMKLYERKYCVNTFCNNDDEDAVWLNMVIKLHLHTELSTPLPSTLEVCKSACKQRWSGKANDNPITDY